MYCDKNMSLNAWLCRKSLGAKTQTLAYHCNIIVKLACKPIAIFCEWSGGNFLITHAQFLHQTKVCANTAEITFLSLK
jgi:hypothetical protein